MIKKYGHEEVRCEIMEDFDMHETIVGSPGTCCICIKHNCEESKKEIERLKNIENNDFKDKPKLSMEGRDD